ncbi:hypothetical protein [Mucisphaera sp.]|uniref:hypothetical protein n=1 Tax=Mucisphaera sp. TaxID=2913024 RepID=UPI003D10B50B
MLKGFLLAVVALVISHVGVMRADALAEEVDAAIERGLGYLIERQAEDGAWTREPGPAVTAMVLEVLLAEEGYGIEHPASEKALAYVLSFVREDGGIHGGFLENYNTAIVISALAPLSYREEIGRIIDRAHDYLRGLQWSDQVDPQGEVVTETHPYFGGAGYGGSGRPDLSNTSIMLMGLKRSGLDSEDVAYQRALVFLTRLQGVAENDLYGAEVLPRDGGFIYATSVNLNLIGVPESKASQDQIDEAIAGRAVSGLRSYGTMTYAGFMSYLYAELDRDDPRVRAAWGWLRENFALTRNPGMPEAQAAEGLFYYYLVMARALSAWGEARIETLGGERAWARDLAAQLISIQAEDGSWSNETPRWMESDPNLATAYSLLALQEARAWLEAGSDE